VQREAVVGSRTTLASACTSVTARDLALPVPLYDMEAYYRTVRSKWFGTGDWSQQNDGAPR
jgi:outer membrane protein